MSNTIYHYVDLRGDLSPLDFPYNEIDYLIFSELAYVNLDHLLDFDTSQVFTLQELFQHYVQRNENYDENTLKHIYNESHFLFEKMAQSPRYQNIQIISYVNDVDKELIKQFAAMTLILEDQTMVVVYRGTDDDLIGWHEDFLMLCENIVPAQMSSVKYLEHVSQYPYQATLLQSLSNSYLDHSIWRRFLKHLRYQKKRPIILTGHSKGGNLAMYAGCFSKNDIKQRLRMIYNYDGPGFQDEIMLSSEYKDMLPRIQSYIPHYSFFGIVLGHEESYTVVKSQNTGMYQHDGFSWEVNAQHFIEDELSIESVEFAIQVILFLNKLNNDDKHAFVKAMFGLFDSLKLYTFSDLSHISYKLILNALKELTLLDNKVRKMLIEVLHMLWLEAKKAKRN